MFRKIAVVRAIRGSAPYIIVEILFLTLLTVFQDKVLSSTVDVERALYIFTGTYNSHLRIKRITN